MHFILQTLLATLFTYLMTTLGSMIVLFIKKLNNKLLSFFFGLSSGIMIASSFFSLLLSSLEEINTNSKLDVFLLVISFSLGAFIIFIIDLIYNKKEDSSLSLMTLSITLHNIPEGMAIGVAFGLCFLSDASYTNAWILALGIGIQNFPEGSAVSLPLYSSGYSKKKAFFIGQCSGLVEIIFGVLGALFVLLFNNLLPFILSFAAGTMIYVVCSELIPSTFEEKKNPIGILGILLGFILMMSLDLLL